MCGHGPSGRNGGFCETLWSNLPDLVARFGPGARAGRGRGVLGERGDDRAVVRGKRRRGLVQAERVPARLHRGAAGRGDRPRACAGAPAGKVVALDGAALRSRCDSPRFRRGLFVPDDATVHPARLALGLRARVIERGARVFERSRVTALRGTVAETAHGRVRAGAAVIAVNAAARGVKPLRQPPRGHLLAHRAHRAGARTRSRRWAGPAARASPTRGPSCTTSAPRTTTGSCSGGAGAAWRWGRGSAGASRSTRRSPRRPAGTSTRCSPATEGVAHHARLGRPDRRQPSHLPQVGTLEDARVHFAFGFTGNGVGPCHLAGRILAARAAGDPRGRAAGGRHASRSRASRSPGRAGCSSARRSCAASGSSRRAAAPTRSRGRSRAAPRALGIHVGR